MMKTGSFVQLIAVPYDSGRRGARMGAGPEALMPPLAAGLRGGRRAVGTAPAGRLRDGDQQRRLGALHQRPRWARAFKWAPMTAVTRLDKIAIRVGRTGALNPWAMLEPVEVGGVTVSRATLHNEEDINRKQIREGDDVIIQRAGDVIPQIVGPAGAHRPGTHEFRMPERCPLCDTPIVKPRTRPSTVRSIDTSLVRVVSSLTSSRLPQSANPTPARAPDDDSSRLSVSI